MTLIFIGKHAISRARSRFVFDAAASVCSGKPVPGFRPIATIWQS
jgi:hypothetical protein